ncbi:MAG TPA: DUF4062 domain-containing protein [Pyrinomonadaceae bacterium]|nr:DUF4062 domain-containing protein [Pyrinomonadaceae bacterium]
MADLIKLLRAFVSSPGDMVEERGVVEEVINELNLTLPSSLKIRLELIKWETHAYAHIGDDAQSVINKQIGDEYDIFIGLMGTRFGTQTPRAGSGTEEEFNRAHERYLSDPSQLRILFYFKNSPVLPSDLDPDQFKRAVEFRNRLRSEGLFWTYETAKEFRTFVSRHLQQHLRGFGVTWGVSTASRPLAEGSEDRASDVKNSAGVSVLSTKKVFARINANAPEYQKSFLVRYPVVEGITSDEVLQKINSVLSYERVFDVSIKEEIEETWGLSSLDFEVNYLKNPFLDTTLMIEGIGAYPWQHSITIVVNVETGEQVKAADLFEESSMELLASRVNELVQLDKKKANLLLSYENNEADSSGWFDDRFGPTGFVVNDLNHFSIEDYGITFLFDFGFPHVIKAFEPEGRYFFSFHSLRPFIKRSGVLDGFLKTLNYE